MSLVVAATKPAMCAVGMDVCMVRLIRDLRGLYVCVWREVCLESSNYLLFFL